MFAKMIFKVFDRQTSHKMVVMSLQDRKLFFLYGSVWSMNWTVYDFHVRSTREEIEESRTPGRKSKFLLAVKRWELPTSTIYSGYNYLLNYESNCLCNNGGFLRTQGVINTSVTPKLSSL